MKKWINIFIILAFMLVLYGVFDNNIKLKSKSSQVPQTYSEWLKIHGEDSASGQIMSKRTHNKYKKNTGVNKNKRLRQQKSKKYSKKKKRNI